jgi:hypothetical protein
MKSWHNFTLDKTVEQLQESGTKGCNLCKLFADTCIRKMSGRSAEPLSDFNVSLLWKVSDGGIRHLTFRCGPVSDGEYLSENWEVYMKHGGHTLELRDIDIAGLTC